MSAPVTPTAPARLPDGWWMGHPRYRAYVLFSATGLLLALVALILLNGIRSLAQGAVAWDAYVAALGGPVGTPLAFLLLIGTGFFSVRWLRVGVKVATVPIGPVPAPPGPVILVVNYVGLVTLTAVILAILSGVIL